MFLREHRVRSRSMPVPELTTQFTAAARCHVQIHEEHRDSTAMNKMYKWRN